MDDEPLYVNARQYHRILKRRAARAREAEVRRLSTQRKVSEHACLPCPASCLPCLPPNPAFPHFPLRFVCLT